MQTKTPKLKPPGLQKSDRSISQTSAWKSLPLTPSLQGLSSLAGAQTPAPSGTTPFQESSLLHIQKLPLLDFHFSGSSGHTAEHSSSFSLMRPVVQPDPFFPKRGEGAYLLQPPELRSKPPGAAPCNWNSPRCRQNNFHLTRSNRLCQAL